MTDAKDSPDDCEIPEEWIRVPDVHPWQFEQARALADLVWQTAIEVPATQASEPPISVACLTAALLFKRACVALKLPRSLALVLSGLYLRTAHELIAARRAAQREEN